MARPIVVSLGDSTSSFSFSKVERKQLYVSRRRMALDGDGEPCGRAALTRDGRFMIRPGMTVVDLGSAPGGWVLVTDDNEPRSTSILFELCDGLRDYDTKIAVFAVGDY